jgi:hypothetical protein
MPVAGFGEMPAAMAWKVPVWLCGPQHFGDLTSAYPGRIVRT